MGAQQAKEVLTLWLVAWVAVPPLAKGLIEGKGSAALGRKLTVGAVAFRPWSLEGKRIEARPILDLVPPMEVGALWHPKRNMSTPAETFQQFLLHAYGY